MTAKEKFNRIEFLLKAEKEKARVCWESNFPQKSEDDFRSFWVGWLESGVNFNSIDGLKIELV